MKSSHASCNSRSGQINLYSIAALVVLAAGLGVCGFLVFGQPAASEKTESTPTVSEGDTKAPTAAAQTVAQPTITTEKQEAAAGPPVVNRRPPQPSVLRRAAARRSTPPRSAARRPNVRVASAAQKKPKTAPQIRNYFHRLKPPKPARGQAKGAPPLLALDTHDPANPLADFGILFREIVRQALLVAAREELGLPTRDRTLREPIADAVDFARMPLGVLVTITSKGFVQVTVFQRKGDTYDPLWEKSLTATKGAIYEQLVTHAESWSRREFPALLKRAGLNGRPNKRRKSAPVPEKTEALLWDWNFLAQFAALRHLHREIKTNGESPELLAALARGYAHLGTLSSFHWSPAHKAFKARALIYAERMITTTQSSPAALYLRAYVRGLIGRHAAALKDLQAARDRKPKVTPVWAEPLEAYCRFERKKLASVAAKKSKTSVAVFLRFLSSPHWRSNLERLKAIEAVTNETADCFFAIDRIFEVRQLDAKRTGSSAGLMTMAATLYQRCASVPDLPADVRKLIAGRPKDVSPDRVDIAAEIPTRIKLVAALRAAGAKDAREPSLYVMAQLIDEVGFVHARRSVAFERKSLAIDADETLTQLFPLAKRHPFAEFLNTYRWNARDAAAAARRLDKSLDLTELEHHEVLMAVAIGRQLGQARLTNLSRTIFLHHDDVADDIVNSLGWVRNSPKGKSVYVKMLQDVSPEHPLTVVHTIGLSALAAAPRLAAWEKKYADDANVLRAVATAYQQLNKPADAERVLKRAVEISPERTNYNALASLYYRQKKFGEWQDTLDASLKLPSLGLDHARTRVTIARHFMARREFKKAQPYADAAAGTYAAWALLCAGDCADRLKDWEKAEAYYRAASGRYRSQATRWYYWCCRTGRGDRKTAQKLVLDHFRAIGPKYTTRQNVSIGMCAVLAGENEAALIHLQKAFDASTDPVFGMHLALLAEEMKNVKVRELTMKKIAARAKLYRTASGKSIVAIAAELGKCLAGGKDAKLDLKKVDKLIADMVATDARRATSMQYVVGRLLDLRGDAKNARRYLNLAAASPQAYVATTALAGDLMRKRGWKVGEIRNTVLPAK